MQALFLCAITEKTCIYLEKGGQVGMESWQLNIAPFMPTGIGDAILKIKSHVARDVNEIRLRADRPLLVQTRDSVFALMEDGSTTNILSRGIYVKKEDCENTLLYMAKRSLYAFQDEIKNGFITIKGGYRVGLAGSVVVKNGAIENIRDFSGLNIRIARNIEGCSNELMPYLYEGRYLLNTLIISAPQMGKTTLLRDIAKNISNGFNNKQGKKVCIIDERSEIANEFNVGIQTDVLDRCPKSLGIMLALRTLSPDVIITDEIGKREDLAAIEEALNGGVSVVTSAHGHDFKQIMRRPILSRAVKDRMFERYVILGSRGTIGSIDSIYDGEQKMIFTR